MEKGDVLLVGSVPFESIHDVFRTCSDLLGEHLYALPDGEINERSLWILALPYLSYVKNKDIEPIHLVPFEKVKSPDSHDPEKMRATRSSFRIRPGVKETTFDLPYGHAAIKSYKSFCDLRRKGEIPDNVRFQVSIPCTLDGTSGFFPEPGDLPIAMRGYERGLKAAIDVILQQIPPNDLVIQLDYCSELLDIVGARDKYLPGADRTSANEKLAKYTAKEYLAAMTEMIPGDVLLGYHICYGTWGGWPMGEVKDIGLCVQLANALVANTPRRVDFFHLPVMPGASDEFFKPLSGLRIGQTRIFLGIELADGVDALCRRAESARRYLPRFGIAHYCGYGRDEPGRVRKLIRDLRVGAEILSN